MMRIITTVALAAVVSGCSISPRITGYYSSNVDPYADITPTSKLLVEPYSKGDVLTNKRYQEKLLAALSEAGYINASLSMPSTPDFYLVFDYRIEISTETENVPIYGTKKTGQSTNCQSYTYGSSTYSNTNCQTYNQTKRVITGYTTVESDVEKRVLHITLVDPDNNMVYNSISYTRGNRCSKWKMFDFLTEQTIKHIDFENPVDSTQTIEMPKDYSCI